MKIKRNEVIQTKIFCKNLYPYLNHFINENELNINLKSKKRSYYNEIKKTLNDFVEKDVEPKDYVFFIEKCFQFISDYNIKRRNPFIYEQSLKLKEKLQLYNKDKFV